MKAAVAIGSIIWFWFKKGPTQSNNNLSRYWLTPE